MDSAPPSYRWVSLLLVLFLGFAAVAGTHFATAGLAQSDQRASVQTGAPLEVATPTGGAVATGPVVADSHDRVTRDPIDDLNDTYWLRQTINVTGLNASHVVFEHGQHVVLTRSASGNVTAGSGFVRIDFSRQFLASPTGTWTIRAVYDGTTVQGPSTFEIRPRPHPTFAFENRSVAESENTSLFVNFSRDRYDLRLESDDMTTERLASLVPAATRRSDAVVVPDVRGNATLLASPRCLPAGRYVINGTVVGGNETATASLTVAQQAVPDFRLENGVTTAGSGEVAEFGVRHGCDYVGNSSGLVISRPEGADAYELVARLPRNATHVYWDTATAGRSHQPNVSDSDVLWAEDADGNRTPVTIVHETPVEGSIPAGVEYDLDLGRSVAEARNNPLVVGSIYVVAPVGNDSSTSDPDTGAGDRESDDSSSPDDGGTDNRTPTRDGPSGTGPSDADGQSGFGFAAALAAVALTGIGLHRSCAG